MKVSFKPSDKKSLYLKILFIGLISYILFVASIFPFEWFQNVTGGPVCLFKRFTGAPCLFCGITSSLLNSFRSNLKEAFFHNPAGVFIFITFVGVTINILLEVCTKKRVSILLNKREKIIAIVGIISLLLVNWVFKIING